MLLLPRLLSIKSLPREFNKPDSVSRRAGIDVYPSGPKLTLWLKLPTRKRCGHTIASLFGIAPDKAFLAANVATGTGGLLHHHFTLAGCPRHHAVCFCGAGSALLQLPVRKYPAQGVRTFLCALWHSRHLSFPWKKLFHCFVWLVLVCNAGFIRPLHQLQLVRVQEAMTTV